MVNKLQTKSITTKEVIFQLVLHLMVFVFYSFDRDDPLIEMQKVVYFLHYTFAAFIINYFFLPRFLYQKKHWQFSISVAIVIIIVILIEELVLEPIYFPKRANSFPGLLFTLTQILPVITILTGFKFAWDALTKQKEVDQLKDAVKESELQFLKSQINPHFLFNNLNNLYSYAIDNSPKTPEIILELSGVLRYMLYECRENYVPLEKEITQLENFSNLNEMQIEERGNVNFSAQNIQPGFQIAPLILIVFIENAFKHSTASQTNQIMIDINIELVENVLKFVCKNSYQLQSNTENISNGIGLENVKKRLELLYPNEYLFEIKDHDNIYEVHLSIELEKPVKS